MDGFESDPGQGQFFVSFLNQVGRILLATSFLRRFLSDSSLSERKFLNATNDSACKSSFLWDKIEHLFELNSFFMANSKASFFNPFDIFDFFLREKRSDCECGEAILKAKILPLQSHGLEDWRFLGQRQRQDTISDGWSIPNCQEYLQFGLYHNPRFTIQSSWPFTARFTMRTFWYDFRSDFEFQGNFSQSKKNLGNAF